MNLPWQRSRLFWIGLVGLVFLVWIWLGFQSRSVDLCWGTKKAEYCAGWGGWGQMAIVINERRQPYIGLEGSPDLGFSWYIEELDPDDGPELIAPALFLDTDRFGIFVANWLVVGLYTALWLSGLGIWQRRKRRLAKLHS